MSDPGFDDDARVEFPHDLDAERSVLGACLVRAQAADEIRDELTPEDFYREGHRRIFRALQQLRATTPPVAPDLITLKDRLAKNGDLDEAGGVSYIARLVDGMPRGTNVGHYAAIVRRFAALREILALGRAAVGGALDANGDPDALLETLQGGLLRVSTRSAAAHDFETMESLLSDFLEHVEDVSSGKLRTFTTTGIGEFDRLLDGGLRPGLALLAARTSHGKAQPLDADVLTPTGFVKMGDLLVGDMVTGADGQPCRVTGIFEQGELDVFRVTFSDGAVAECCDDHLWFTQSHRERINRQAGSVKDLRTLRRTLTCDSRGRRAHRVPLTKPIHFTPTIADRRLHPYALGLLLGDGSFDHTVRFTCSEPDVQEGLRRVLPDGDTLSVDGVNNCRVKRERRSNARSETHQIIEAIGLAGCPSERKFIPPQYLNASINDRWLLLRGLFDSDGHVVKEGSAVEYVTVSEQLARDVTFLARSLGALVAVGYKAEPRYRYRGEHRVGQPAWRVCVRFPNGGTPIASKKHLARWRETRLKGRLIQAIDPAGRKACRCISVSAADRLYVTNDFVVTHNTALAVNLAVAAARLTNLQVAFFSLEQNRVEVRQRLLAMMARIDARALKRCDLKPYEWSRVTDAMGILEQLPIRLYCGPATLSMLRAMTRRIRAAGELGLVVVDYLQRVDLPQRGRNDTREAELGRLARSLQELGHEVGAPVLALAQLSRETEKRGGKPQLSDLRESGSLEQDADLVLLLHRPSMHKSDEPHDLVVLHVAKHRQGQLGTVRLRYTGPSFAFEDWEISAAQAAERTLFEESTR